MKLMNAPFEPAPTPFDWLSRDNEEVGAFIDDPLCFLGAVAGRTEQTPWRPVRMVATPQIPAVSQNE